MRTIFYVIIIITLINVTPGDLYAEQTENDTISVEYGDQPLRSPRGAMLRSLIIPGWGQYYNQQKTKAVILAGLQLGCAAGIVIADHRAYQNYDRANEAETETIKQHYREQYDDNLEWKSFFKWWLILLTLYSVGDAYVEAHLSGFDIHTFDHPVAVSMTPSSEEITVQMKVSF